METDRSSGRRGGVLAQHGANHGAQPLQHGSAGSGGEGQQQDFLDVSRGTIPGGVMDTASMQVRCFCTTASSGKLEGLGHY